MDQKNDLLNLIRNINKRHVKRDIQDRIIAMDDKSDKVVVYTSENVLAQVIGKQVARAFKGGELDILFSHNEDAVRVSYQFK